MKLLKHYGANRKFWPTAGLRGRLRRQPNSPSFHVLDLFYLFFVSNLIYFFMVIALPSIFMVSAILFMIIWVPLLLVYGLHIHVAALLFLPVLSDLFSSPLPAPSLTLGVVLVLQCWSGVGVHQYTGAHQHQQWWQVG